MSNYVKATNFTAKDGLPSGNPSKIIKGAEIDTELTAVASAISSKADSNSPSFTGTPTAPTAVAGTNTTQVATTAFATAAAAASFPVGGIIMWSGSIASIPSGWALCNGSNGTPDLRNRFIIGAHSDNVGVANTTITGSGTQTGGSKDAIAVSHTHTATSSVSDPQHSHGTPAGGNYMYLNGASIIASTVGGNNIGIASTTGSASTGITVSTTVASAGSSGTNANLPPYYALAFIIKT